MAKTVSVSYCQYTVQEMSAKKLCHDLLAWLDDLFCYFRERDGLLVVFDEVLVVCAAKGLKLHPQRSVGSALPMQDGRATFGAFVTHIPVRV